MPRPIEYLIWSFQDFSKDNGPQWAAALSYYALMSVFPLMLAALSVATMFVDVNWAIDQVMSLTRSFMPVGQDQIASTIRGVYAARGPASVVSIVLLLWSGSQIFGVATQALNIAFDVDNQLSFIKRALVQLAMAITLGLLLAAALASRLVISLVWNMIFPNGQLSVVGTLLQYAVQGLLLLMVMYFAYRYVPRTTVHPGAAWTGAIFATVLFLIVSPVFSYYVTRFGNYNLVYGALATVVILVLWAYIGASIFLLGGEMAALIDGIKHKGKTREEIVKHHELRSPLRRVKEAVAQHV
jgi:membrane protein